MRAVVRCLPFAICSLLSATGTVADEVQGPVSPQESLQHVVVEDGLRVELVASEPQIVDPVAIRFDEKGRLWVVEMRDYPTAATPGIRSRSRISVLRDRNNDGFFETATVFADDLPYATGLQPWRGGVVVTMSGQVAYMKDTSGDGRADLVETWYSGFAEGNTQLRASHPRLGLDNHIYIANGLRGGTIRDARREDAPSVSISGMDFRFDPLTRHYEAVSGVGQFGLTFDDYGNRFVCSNRNPAIHIVLEDRYLKQNPLVSMAAVSTDVAKAGAESRIFPIGRAWTTSHLHAGQFTAACGLVVYRGDLLPDEYYGNLLVCEPTGHLVHREIMQPFGATFRSAAAREGTAFFASRDPWCSPVSLEIGPDGGLYVVDMYRAVIEHPDWMPTELRQRPDLVEGNDRGRIYRVVPTDFRRPPPPRLVGQSSEALVDRLGHRNAWWRETAARLLLERQDKTVAARLRALAIDHEWHVARIQATRLLEGIGSLDEELLMVLLDDAHPRVLEQAILAAEARVSESAPLREKIAALASHSDARVRFQALLTARPQPSVPQYPADRWELEAMRIAAGDRGAALLADVLEHPEALRQHVAEPQRFVADLARLAAAAPGERGRSPALLALAHSEVYGRSGLTGYFAEASRRGTPAEQLRSELDERAGAALQQVLEAARRDAVDRDTPKADRGETIDLLAQVGSDARLLARLARDEPLQPLRLQAIAGLAKGDEALADWRDLLDGFPEETPAVRGAIVDGLLQSSERTEILLEYLADGRIKPSELDANRAQRLLKHRDAAVKQRAEQLFAEAVPADRAQALADYQVVLSLEGEAARGRAVFAKHCAACHRIGDVGTAFAPDISDSRQTTIAQLLTDIIQPNRAIDSNFFSYTAVTIDGRVHTGVLAAETSTSITLKQAEGREVTLRREEIDELRSDGVSFMPEGLERDISPQEMADLIGFIKNWRYLDEPQAESAAVP